MQQKLINKRHLKSFNFMPSGRSSDFISPSFGHGCLLNCTYCYLKRHVPVGLNISTNINEILSEINSHALFDMTEKPNQVDDTYTVYDISCSEDFALHSKYYNWKDIFRFFKAHPKAKATLATKVIPPEEWLDFNPNQKVRIRFSLMPNLLSRILEPNTAFIADRIIAVNKFVEAGYEVHLNFSPVIVFQDWLKEYNNLFQQIDRIIKPEHKANIKSEVIFLTHNKRKHEYNLNNKLSGEHFIWVPDFQENKLSNNGDINIRYKNSLKKRYINEFTELHDRIIPWNTIRYIF